MGSVTVEIAGLLLLASAFGGALGTGVLAIRLYVQFKAREDELQSEIRELRASYDALIDLMVRERLISVESAEKVKKSTGPLKIQAGRDIITGGDVAGGDKTA